MRKLKVTAAVGGAVMCTFAACGDGGQAPASRQASFSEAEQAACLEGWQKCIDGGGDESACKAGYQQCAEQGGAVPGDDTTEPPKEEPGPGDTGDTGSGPVATDCQAARDACFAAGESSEVCKGKYEFCAAATPTDPGTNPDPTTVNPGCPDFDYSVCVSSGGTPEECKAKLEICQNLTPVEPNPEELPPAPSAEEECQKLTAACFETAEDPSVCKEKYEACVAGFYPEVIPEPVANDCAAAAQACFDAGEDPEVCKKKQELCLGYEPPPAADLCQDAFAACVAGGVDEVTCKEKLMACEGWFVEPPTDPGTGSDDKGNACLAGLDACLGVAGSETQVDACYNGFQACDWSVRQAEGGAEF